MGESGLAIGDNEASQCIIKANYNLLEISGKTWTSGMDYSGGMHLCN
jgi:hypothetical protein